MKIYSGPLSMFGAKVEIAAREKRIPFDLEMVPFNMRTLYEPKHPEVLRINPKRQVPVLVDGGLEIFDSTQIFEYLEDRWPTPALWPNEPERRARARLLEHKSDEVFFPHVIRLMGLQDTPEDSAAIAARSGAADYYRQMEGVLATSDYLAGVCTYADIALYMAQLFAARMGAPMTDDTPRLVQWRDRMTARPAVRRVTGAMATYLVAQGRPLPGFMAAMVSADAGH